MGQKNYKSFLSVGIAIGMSGFWGCASVLAEDEEQSWTVSGRVTEQSKQSAKGVEVTLFDETGKQLGTTSTNQKGEFKLEHKICKFCSLRIVPPAEKSLESASIESIAGNADRNFVVALQHGFAITGNISGDGKGLKGLDIKVVPAGAGEGHINVHGGGFAKTNKNGTYKIILTPGAKILTVYNDKYPNFARTSSLSFDVTEEKTVNDVTLGSAGAAK